MAQSKEYPALRWVEPRSWTNANRSSVQLIVIHTTEGSAHNRSAEDGAAYDARRTDGTSAHYFVDNDSIVQCVLTADIAHTARGQGNRRGIHYELCTRAATPASGWADPYHSAMLKRAAEQVAKDCKKWGIPVRKLSSGQVLAGARGLCGHVEISNAFKQSDHTDPGKSFPWHRFISMIERELNPPKPQTPPKENTVALDAADRKAINDDTRKAIKELITDLSNQTTGGGLKSGAGSAVLSHGWPLEDGDQRTPHWANLQAMWLKLKDVEAGQQAILEKLGDIEAQLAGTEEPPPVDPPA